MIICRRMKQHTACHVVASKASNRSSRVLGVLAHTHSDSVTLSIVSTYFTMVLFTTHLILAINVEVGKGGVGESHRRRGQGSEKHRLSLHCGGCSIAVGSKRIAVVSFGRISVIV